MTDKKVRAENKRRYEEHLRAVGFHCHAEGEGASYWHRHRDGARATMRAGWDFVPVVKTASGARLVLAPLEPL